MCKLVPKWGRTERETDSQAGSMLSAQSLTWSMIPPVVRSWPERKSRVRRLTDWASQAPQISKYFNQNVLLNYKEWLKFLRYSKLWKKIILSSSSYCLHTYKPLTAKSFTNLKDEHLKNTLVGCPGSSVH